MENKENIKSNWFTKFLFEKSSIVGIILMCCVFIFALIAHFILNKISAETMLISQVGSIVFILFFLLLDIQDKLDKIDKKLNNK